MNPVFGIRDDRICIVTPDIAGTPLSEFRKEFPNRFYNLGIAEANMIGVSAGLSLCGKIPFAITIAIFAVERCFEQIRQDACYQKQNINIVGFGGGTVYGPLAATHHAIEDLAIMRAIPEMTVVSPITSTERDSLSASGGSSRATLISVLATGVSRPVSLGVGVPVDTTTVSPPTGTDSESELGALR